MSSGLRTPSSAVYPNNTDGDGISRDVVYECKVFNISILAVSVCVLTVTAVMCCVSYVKRWRQRKRACEYESDVACDLQEGLQVNLKAVQRSQSLCNLRSLFRQESLRKDDSSIYCIYTNPLPVTEDGEEDFTNTTDATRTLNDPKDAIVLDPLTFVMQL
ncbi:uncharacterized protein si:dkey-246e1.3 [Silurus meridionalis]|uniref:Uncharacterized protein n=1 Tax=Silurus meridionalis TaxID=175797 RepID=A0A8T0AB68_SILME|nr:uncharacterized protein si:dkey-246e1.3 [Silurus meridionalis]XP_046696720.1 uncharacterized protein si:dkey-246e1.3 [Silurus meridionalis]XP_046696721.1 uncharacterized protein si:dkey-246e1.3 [Silurus meridionalis]XP_046696722.1 uncharacterized protein si:dkey-246e1.3 [Silurus meridionalis]KAF7688294.1 hypothetical protein HF521_014300 [Silurus meridionalis]